MADFQPFARCRDREVQGEAAIATPVSPYQTARPARRRLRVYSRDPSLEESLATAGLLETVLHVPWECDPDDPARDGPAPGPVGEYLAVMDYDPAGKGWYAPVDLNTPYLLAEGGFRPSDGHPQFHQQMVYAVAMNTIGHFEAALGRPVLWRALPDEGGTERYTRQLRIHPHALREANAYYCPAKAALLFGYFKAPDAPGGHHMPGAVVFTCLSHDIIAHETTHAIVDGLHPRFLNPSNPDVLAFHEAFADLVALFQQFAVPDLLQHEMLRSRGRLFGAGEGIDLMLGDLGRQFGRATGRGAALRSYIGTTPDPGLIATTTTPHARGALLVAAVFQAFIAIYRARSADLWRIAERVRHGDDGRDISYDLAARLSREAARTARQVMGMAIRALDYLPPVDVNFGDFLRALITADLDSVPDDDLHYRAAFIEAFRHWSLYPRDVRSMSVESLRWQGPRRRGTDPDRLAATGYALAEAVAGWDLRSGREALWRQLRDRGTAVGEAIAAAGPDLLASLGLDASIPAEVVAVRPVRRAGADGHGVTDAAIELVQTLPDAAPGGLPFEGGATLLLDPVRGELRYVIGKNVHSARRQAQQADFADRRAAAGSPYRDALTGGNPFAFVHRAVDGAGEGSGEGAS